MPPDTPTQYRAVGFLRARYLPNADKFRQGTLVTDDGLQVFERKPNELKPADEAQAAKETVSCCQTSN